MIKTIIADTGPIVALLDRRQAMHDWADDKFQTLPKPLLTCEAVITEACYLMRHSKDGSKDILFLLKHDALRIAFSLAEETDSVAKLMQKYADVPMSLADACLVRMSELFDESSVFTLDSDFHVFRRNRNKAIGLVTVA